MYDASGRGKKRRWKAEYRVNGASGMEIIPAWLPPGEEAQILNLEVRAQTPRPQRGASVGVGGEVLAQMQEEKVTPKQSGESHQQSAGTQETPQRHTGIPQQQVATPQLLATVQPRVRQNNPYERQVDEDVPIAFWPHLEEEVEETDLEDVEEMMEEWVQGYRWRQSKRPSDCRQKRELRSNERDDRQRTGECTGVDSRRIGGNHEKGASSGVEKFCKHPEGVRQPPDSSRTVDMVQQMQSGEEVEVFHHPAQGGNRAGGPTFGSVLHESIEWAGSGTRPCVETGTTSAVQADSSGNPVPGEANHRTGSGENISQRSTGRPPRMAAPKSFASGGVHDSTTPTLSDESKGPGHDMGRCDKTVRSNSQKGQDGGFARSLHCLDGSTSRASQSCVGLVDDTARRRSAVQDIRISCERTAEIGLSGLRTEESPKRVPPKYGQISSVFSRPHGFLGAFKHQIADAIPGLRETRRGRKNENGERSATSLPRAAGPPSVKDSSFRTYGWRDLVGKQHRLQRLYGMTRPESIPFKAKPVTGSLRWDVLQKLECTPEAREKLQAALMWVEPSRWWTQIDEWMLSHKLRSSRQAIPEEKVEVMRGHKKIVAGSPIAMCNTFTVDEVKLGEKSPDGTTQWKWATRPIVEPTVNDPIKELHLPVAVKFVETRVVRDAMARGDTAIEFDVTSCYDQISIDPRLWKYFGVGEGEVLCVASMGFRPSCLVADAVVSALLPPKMEEEVRAFTRVDNVVFVGPHEGTVAAAREFEERCKRCGVVLNSETGHGIPKTSVDFNGEKYDLQNHTVQNTGKTKEKLALVERMLKTESLFTARQVAAFVGLSIFASQAAGELLAKHHFCIRLLAEIEQGCCGSKDQWDVQMCLKREQKNGLQQWIRALLDKEPCRLDTGDEGAPEIEIYTDASEWGWGAVSIWQGRTVETCAAPWSPEERALWRVECSVVAEPLAVVKAVCRCLKARGSNPDTRPTVKLWTDHLPIVWAARKGVGKAFSYSHMLTCLSQMNYRFIFGFVAGKDNPADALSRGRQQPYKAEPPVLQVTSIGRWGRGKEADG